MGDLNRREALAAGAGVVAAAVAAPEAEGRRRRRRQGPVDVVVVGAGLAGLSAARELRRHRRSVLVLEARDRVGGRTFDHRLPGGRDVVELGGQWAGPGQNRVLALARALGVATFPTYSAGKSLYVAGGKRSTYDGDIPPANPVALAELETLILLLNSMAKSVNPAAPWRAARAGEFDQQTVATFIDANVHTAEGRDLARTAIRGVYGEDAKQIGLLDLLAAIGGVGGDFNTLIGSAQTIRFVGGPQQLSIRLAMRLGKVVRLRSEVVSIDHGSHGVTVHTRSASIRARHAIVTVPKSLLTRLRFAPELPPAHAQLFQRQPTGSVLKVNAIYPAPFWRAQGLNGSAVSDRGPLQIVYDNSPPSGRPGVLVGFAEGDESRALFGASAARRRALALDSLVRLFGSEAGRPSGYVDRLWATDPFARGAYGSFSPPGVLTSLGPAADEPVGRLRFAGADFSPDWPGYMDGAIGSGIAAALSVL